MDADLKEKNKEQHKSTNKEYQSKEKNSPKNDEELLKEKKQLMEEEERLNKDKQEKFSGKDDSLFSDIRALSFLVQQGCMFNLLETFSIDVFPLYINIYRVY